MKKIFNVEGMSCAACSASIEHVLGKMKGVSRADVSLSAKTLICEFDENIVDVKAIVKAVKKAGFKLSEKDSKGGDVPDLPSSSGAVPIKIRLSVSVVFLLPLLYLSMGRMLSLPLSEYFADGKNAVAFAFLQFLLTLPILFVNRQFFESGIPALIRGHANMDSLVSLGASASLIYGIVSIFLIGNAMGNADFALASRYSSHLYFESAGMILTLVSVGKFLEERSSKRTSSAIDRLKKLRPTEANVIRDGEEITVDISELQVGDTVAVRQGERIQVDGIVIEGESSVDTSILTGESMPKDVTVGDRVLASSLNINGFLKIKAQSVGKESTFEKIISMISEAGATKAPQAKLADRISRIFVPCVLCIAALTAVIWLAAGAGFERAFEFSVSVLVVSCPCALGLATPLSITVAIGRSASRGLLVKDAAVFSKIAVSTAVVFDKTGTVTVGSPRVTDIYSLIEDDELLRLSAALESGSSHPIARAICNEYKGKAPEVVEFNSIFGRGVSAVVEGRLVLAGNLQMMTEAGIDTSLLAAHSDRLEAEGKSTVYISRDGVAVGLIAVADTVRDGAEDAVGRLKALGKTAVLLSGDHRACAEAVGNALGFDRIISDVLPDGKEKVIAEMQEKGETVIMIGDGVNDSPAMACRCINRDGRRHGCCP